MIELYKCSHIIWILFAINCFTNADLIGDSDTYDIEYSLGTKDTFQKLTTFNLKQLKQNQNTYLLATPQPLTQTQNAPANNNNNQYTIQIYSEQLNDYLKNEIFSLIETQQMSIIRLRICKQQAIQQQQCTVSTFTYLSNLLQNGNQIQLNLTLHLNNNIINSLTIRVPKLSTNYNSNEQFDLNDDKYYLSVNVGVNYIKPAQLPDTYSYVEKVKREIEAKKESAKDENKSFLSRYWYYIVPFVVIVLLMNMVNPEQAAGGGSR